MGKGSSPPAPPDYTAEKTKIRTDTEKKYGEQADAYNTAVDTFNTALGGFQSDYDALSSALSGANISSLYDDPTTEANENIFDVYSPQISNLATNLGNLDTDLDKPIFESSVGSEYGPIGITNIPDLNKFSTTDYDTLSSNISSLADTLNQLKADRAAEEKRITDFGQSLNQGLGGMGVTLGQLGIADLASMNQLEKQLSDLNLQKQGFSSDIMGQFMPGGFSNFQNQYDTLTAGLADLQGKRQTELDRISTFGDTLYTDVDSYFDRLDNLGITDEAGIASLIDDIEDRQRQAGRFSSELGFNFGNQLGELQDVLGDVKDLQSERVAELARLENAKANFLSQAGNVEQAAEGGNMFSAAILDNIDDQIRDLKNEIAGFSSELDFDFSGATGAIADAETALAGLQGERTTALDDILSRVQTAGTGIGDIALSDEDAITGRQSDLQKLQQELAKFSGGRVGNISGEITAGLEQVDARLADLATKRAEIETAAQQLVEDLNNASFYALDDLTGSQTAFDQQKAQVDLFNAQQALDEIAAAEQRLQSEKQRLETDAEAVAARSGQAQQDLLASIGASGVPEFQNFAQIDPITLEQYLNLLAQGGDEEELGALANLPSAFSQNLGVISV
jgi:predicted DNA-binding ribbon-helix-helix protein